MAISFTSHEIKFIFKNKRKVVSWIKEVLYNNDKKLGVVSIIFTSDNYLLQINKQYLNHNYFTDVITFDYSYKSKIEGDIFISIETIYANSLEYHSTFNNELLRVVIHGVLHLIGFNDQTHEERNVMRKQENECLEIYFRKYE